jgi:Trypsin
MRSFIFLYRALRPEKELNVTRAYARFILLVITSTAVLRSWSVPQAVAVSQNEIVFHAVSELTKPTGAQVTVRGARLADPKEWPASFYSVHPNETCTSTLIGPRALLTAAHCTPNKAPVAIEIGTKVYRGTCVQSTLYSPISEAGASADWALCLFDSDIPVSHYETVNLDPTRIKKGTELLLTGFGCTQQNGTGGNDGNYRIGEVNVSDLPSGKGNYISTSGDVALCFGDSGGAAFLYLDSGKKKRIVVSVNSKMQILDNGNFGKASYLSSLSTASAQDFIRNWSISTRAGVCGITPAVADCQDQ